MSKKLIGRDVNGMHASPWEMVDTSAISKVHVSSKCTNEELCDAVKQMLVASTEALYGDNKDEKYVKIVNLIMQRVREALAQLNDQIKSQSQDIDADEFTQKLAESFQKTLQKNSKKTSDKQHEKLFQQLYNDIVKNLDSYSSKHSLSQQPDEKLKAQGIQNQTASISSSSEDVVFLPQEAQTASQLLVDLSKKIDESFKKIESLISKNSSYSNAESSAVSMQDKIDSKIIEKQAGNEKTVQAQVSSLNAKAGGAVEKSTAKDKDKKAGAKAKSKDLVDAMTGKQFDMLKSLLQRQFLEVVDISSTIVKKVNTGFKSINKRIDELIKRQRSFSFTKLLMFASLFLIPMFWDEITKLFKKFKSMFLENTDFSSKIKEFIDGFKLDIDQKIDEFIDNIDWDKHVSQVASKIWGYVKKRFDQYIKDPMGMMIKAVKSTYDSCVAWVKDLWRYVTGDSTEGKKAQQQKDQFQKQQIQRTQKSVDDGLKSLNDNLSAERKNVTEKASNAQSIITSSTNTITQNIEAGQKTIAEKLSSTTTVIEESSKDITSASKTAIGNAQQSIDKMQSGLDKTIENSVKTISSNTEQVTRDLVNTLNKNGAPTNFSNAMMHGLEEAAKKVEIAKDNVTEPNIEKLQSIKDYVTVKDKTGNNIIATREQVNQQLKNVQQNEKASKSIEFMKNAVDFGKFTSNKAIVDEHTEARMQRDQIYAEKQKSGEEFTQTISSATTESVLERESRWYSGINDAYNSISDNNKILKDGLEQNTGILNAILENTKDIFSDIKTSLKSLTVDDRKTSSSSTIAVLNSQTGEDSAYDAAM